MRLLVHEGAALDCMNGDGASALIMAACGAHKGCVSALVDAAADQDLRCNGKTAFEWAISLGHLHVAKLLEAEAAGAGI